MRFFLFFFLFLFILLPASAYTIKGGVTYTVESARKEAFANVEYTLPKEIIDANRVDPNFKENMKLIKLGVKETADRFIGYFADGGYEIVYKNNLYFEFYYHSDGSLEHLAKREKLTFPLKTYKYDTDGKLIRVTLDLSSNNAYIFFPDGQLESHWLNNKEYDLNGKVINQSY